MTKTAPLSAPPPVSISEMEVTRPEIALIAAVARNGVIGNGGRMPWHLPEDLRHFKRVTWGKPVIMGRKTFQSLGKPLPGRTNIVLTRDPLNVTHAIGEDSGVSVVTSFDEALEEGRAALRRHPPLPSSDPHDIPMLADIMVIGGAEIYALALPRARRLYLTDIPLSPAGDAVFPAFDPALWHEVCARPGTPAVAEGVAPTFRLLESRSRRPDSLSLPL